MELIKVDSLCKTYVSSNGFMGLRKQMTNAVCNVSFTVGRKETLGLVGESGCGKSTVGRLILKLITPTSGNIYLNGKDIAHLTKEEEYGYRRNVQLIFQDSFASLDPRMRVGDTIKETLSIHKIGANREERASFVEKIFEEVGLRKEQLTRYPHEFSGGQRQRVGIARAVCLKPEFIVCDEPVASLDVSVQAQIINMMIDLQKNYGLSYLFISHDLSVVKHISDRIAVMYLGHLVESGSKNDFFDRPLHPYSQALISAIPSLDRHKSEERIILSGEISQSKKEGCVFSDRCWQCKDICRQEAPKTVDIGGGHMVSCHKYL